MVAKPRKFSAAWAKKHGAIIPSVVPECPTCWGVDSVEDEPYLGELIFKCKCCNADVVVIRHGGEEISIELEELDDKEARRFAIQQSMENAGDQLYRPTQLVETTDAT